MSEKRYLEACGPYFDVCDFASNLAGDLSEKRFSDCIKMKSDYAKLPSLETEVESQCFLSIIISLHCSSFLLTPL